MFSNNGSNLNEHFVQSIDKSDDETSKCYWKKMFDQSNFFIYNTLLAAL